MAFNRFQGHFISSWNSCPRSRFRKWNWFNFYIMPLTLRYCWYDCLLILQQRPNLQLPIHLQPLGFAIGHMIWLRRSYPRFALLFNSSPVLTFPENTFKIGNATNFGSLHIVYKCRSVLEASTFNLVFNFGIRTICRRWTHIIYKSWSGPSIFLITEQQKTETNFGERFLFRFIYNNRIHPISGFKKMFHEAYRHFLPEVSTIAVCISMCFGFQIRNFFYWFATIGGVIHDPIPKASMMALKFFPWFGILKWNQFISKSGFCLFQRCIKICFFMIALIDYKHGSRWNFSTYSQISSKPTSLHRTINCHDSQISYFHGW